MKTKAILVSVIVLFCSAGIIQAQEELHGSVGITYQSKYLWRGIDVYGDKSAIQPELNLDFFGTGFGMNLIGHRANSDGYENTERWDYVLYYQNHLFEGQQYVTHYRLGWMYYNFPDMSASSSDSLELQELHAIFSWPEMCTSGIIPSYALVKLWPSNSGSAVGSGTPPWAGATGDDTASGFAHIFMLDYPWVVEGLMPDVPEQTINLHTEFVFNDGVDPRGGNVDHDWSNMVVGACTDFDLGNDMTLTPGVYHQVTMDDSINDDKDETWATLKLMYSF